MATEIGTAYVQIVPSAKGIGKKLSEVLGKASDDAGKDAGKSFGAKLGAGIGTASKAIGTAVAGTVAAGTTAVAALTTSAVQGFAQYEQLAGGVDTLFGEEAGEKIKQYANSAFSTVQMSANDYMDTVTSFSASLIQSMDGDTVAAAEKANTAISSMSDNANKMGSDIESIQNAYSGFAKQNYTMLDNLKLGYGGTKSEMERLIKDASSMTEEMDKLGVSVDAGSMSFDNIVDAIAVVQEHMGIGGSSAEEAATTIEGSINAMKASISNLVTGLANPDADMGVLFDNVLTSVDTALDNLMPAITTTLTSLSNSLNEYAPELFGKLINILLENIPTLLTAAMEIVSAIGNAIVENLPLLSSTALDLIMMLAEYIIESLPQIISTAAEILVTLANGITQSIPTLIPSIVSVTLQIVETLLDNIDMLIDASIDMMIALAEGLIEALPIFIEKAPVIIQKLVDAIIRNLAKLLKASYEIIKKIGIGIVDNLPEIGRAAGKIMKTLIDGLAGFLVEVVNAGKDIVLGLWNGINNKIDWIKAKIKGFGDEILKAIKDIFGIHSPSKVFEEEVGKQLDLGVAVGIEKNTKPVVQSMKVLDEVTLGAIKGNKFELSTNKNSNSNKENYSMLAEAIVSGLEKSGFTISVDGREFGRAIRRYS